MSLFVELKRRNVFRVAVFYAVASWVLLQVGDLLFGALGVPPWGMKLLLGLLLLGFPVALVFSWIFELTPEGIKREQEVDRGVSITGQTAGKLNVLIVVLLIAAIALLLADRFIDRTTPGEPATSVATESAPTSGSSAAPSPATAPDAVAASIAVLPFVNMSEDKANDYFSDGLTEELLNVLANVPGLRVIARTSSFAYKGKEVKIADVARDLNVDHVLEGSVRKSGNRVRITTQLIRSSDSSHLWSQTYDRTLDDIFAVQDEISSEVVDALKVRLLEPQASVAEVGSTHVPEAYEAYLRGRQSRLKGEAEATLREALAAFDEAIRLDPAYARAYAGKADALQVMASNAYLPFSTGFEQSRQAAKRALELAPDLAEGLLAVSYIQATVDADLRGAAESAERALRLSPGNYQVQQRYSGLQASIGQPERAIAAAEKAVELDPIAPEARVTLASALLAARQYDRAEQASRQALALSPDRSGGRFALGVVLFLQGRNDEALAVFDKESIDWQRMTGRALVFAKTGKADQARAEIEAMRQKFGDAASYQYAEINATLGDRDEAFRWLDNARRVRDPGLMGSVFTDPVMDPLRSDPRYDALVRELGFSGQRS